MTKRIFDWVVSSLGLIFLTPIFILFAIWIKCDSTGPVFFRQERMGHRGKTFFIHKFRTMKLDAECYGPLITVGDDLRITRAGRFLRKYKLDELPQLIDVWFGKMSIVGPRPEVLEYVAHYPKDLLDLVLSVSPGITDRASIEFRSEGELLSKADDPFAAYINEILPVKLEYYVDYVKNRSFIGDLVLIWKTIQALIR